MLSAQVVQLYEEFNELYKVFTEKSYDALDPLDPVSYFLKLALISSEILGEPPLTRTTSYSTYSFIQT